MQLLENLVKTFLEKFGKFEVEKKINKLNVSYGVKFYSKTLFKKT